MAVDDKFTIGSGDFAGDWLIVREYEQGYTTNYECRREDDGLVVTFSLKEINSF